MNGQTDYTMAHAIRGGAPIGAGEVMTPQAKGDGGDIIWE